ncbi:hypothetical protein [Amycolatopsis sp. NPDC003731]
MSTPLVIEALYKEVRHMVPAGETFPMDDLATYKERAQAWLKNNSELYTPEIEGADWQEVYETFK